MRHSIRTARMASPEFSYWALGNKQYHYINFISLKKTKGEKYIAQLNNFPSGTLLLYISCFEATKGLFWVPVGWPDAIWASKHLTKRSYHTNRCTFDRRQDLTRTRPKYMDGIGSCSVKSRLERGTQRSPSWGSATRPPMAHSSYTYFRIYQ